MRDFFTRRSTVRHPLLLALGFMILAAVSAASVWLVDQAETEAKWVTHTLAVENQLRSVVQYIRRAESGQRSYLLTASPEDLGDLPHRRSLGPGGARKRAGADRRQSDATTGPRGSRTRRESTPRRSR